jgi:hypothetical protein
VHGRGCCSVSTPSSPDVWDAGAPCPFATLHSSTLPPNNTTTTTTTTTPYTYTTHTAAAARTAAASLRPGIDFGRRPRATTGSRSAPSRPTCDSGLLDSLSPAACAQSPFTSRRGLRPVLVTRSSHLYTTHPHPHDVCFTPATATLHRRAKTALLHGSLTRTTSHHRPPSTPSPAQKAPSRD